MKMLLTGYRIVAALVCLPLLGISLAAAQDAELQARIEEYQKRYEEALTTGNVEEVAYLYAEDAIYMPFTGGTLQGIAEIKDHYEQASKPTALDVRSTQAETLGDMILDIGTFTAEGESGTFEGEYVAVVEETDGELKLHRLISFPARKQTGSGQQ